MAYPLVSRRQVMEQLRSDAAFVRRCVRLLHERTLVKAGGFMASHRKKAAALETDLDSLDDVELMRRSAWLVVYARSLSRILREHELQDPAVAAKAAVFGVTPASPTPLPSPQPPLQTPRRRPGRPKKEPAAESAFAGPAEKPRRRPGRPRKSAEESAKPRLRRKRTG